MCAVLQEREEWLWSRLRDLEAASSVSKGGDISLVSTGQTASSHSLEAGLPSRAWQQDGCTSRSGRWDTKPERFILTWRSHGACFARFWACLGSITPSFFPISPFWSENVYLMLPHNRILEARHLSGVTGSQLDMNFASGWMILQISPISHLCDI